MDSSPKFSGIASLARLPRVIWVPFMAKSLLRGGKLVPQPQPPPSPGHCEALRTDMHTQKAGVLEAHHCCCFRNKGFLGVDKKCGWKRDLQQIDT